MALSSTVMPPLRNARRRTRRLAYRPPPLTIAQILAWADAFHARCRRYPCCRGDGVVPGTLTETWFNIDQVLRKGLRGLPGGSSLARLLAQHRGKRNPSALPPYTERQILRWADTYHRRHDQWPTTNSGPIPKALGETWCAVNAAFVQGSRGMPGSSSLARFLAEQRGVRNIQGLPRLSQRQILRWADDHHERTGRWPKQTSGGVAAAPGETWAALDFSLTYGRRGLPGDTTLASLLARHRGVRNHHGLAPLQIRAILRWIDDHRRRTNKWPHRDSGPVIGARGETWCGVDQALKKGHRGLTGGSSLGKLLASARGVRNRSASHRTC